MKHSGGGRCITTSILLLPLPPFLSNPCIHFLLPLFHVSLGVTFDVFDGSGICLLGFGSFGIDQGISAEPGRSPTYTHYLGWNKKHIDN